ARSIIQGGPLIKNNNTIILDYILKEYNKIIKRKVIYSQFRNFTSHNLEIQNNFAQVGYNYEDHLNIIVDLSIGIDLLWKGVKRNRKDGVNKGKRQGFTFEVTKDSQYIDSFYKLLGLTYQRAKLPYPSKSFFNNLIEPLKNNFQWFILKKENEPIIILLSFTFKKTIYAYYIGIVGNNEILKLRPVDYFYWKVIEWGVENNFNYFDWMGAGKPKKEYGVRKFKLQYGGELLEMGRYEQIHKPVLMEIGKIGLKIYQKIKK
ncbi:GNAT family N-acetyltransferase, partial [Candidatus Dependentiae bacterium]|nr:GNAT family N-acetyltransferase [Candidatus Dependentiae bacterium]